MLPAAVVRRHAVRGATETADGAEVGSGTIADRRPRLDAATAVVRRLAVLGATATAGGGRVDPGTIAAGRIASELATVDRGSGRSRPAGIDAATTGPGLVEPGPGRRVGPSLARSVARVARPGRSVGPVPAALGAEVAAGRPQLSDVRGDGRGAATVANVGAVAAGPTSRSVERARSASMASIARRVDVHRPSIRPPHGTPHVAARTHVGPGARVGHPGTGDQDADRRPAPATDDRLRRPSIRPSHGTPHVIDGGHADLAPPARRQGGRDQDARSRPASRVRDRLPRPGLTRRRAGVLRSIASSEPHAVPPRRRARRHLGSGPVPLPNGADQRRETPRAPLGRDRPATPTLRRRARRDGETVGDAPAPRDRSDARVRPVVIADARRPSSPSPSASREPHHRAPDPRRGDRRTERREPVAVRSGRTPKAGDGRAIQERAGRVRERQAGRTTARRRQSVRRGSPVIQRRMDGEDGVATTTALTDLDIDQIVRELEDRVLAEIDRRGGRFAGSF